MDPLSQAVTGAALAALAARRRPQHLRPAMALGALSGMAADLDILIRSHSDPLLVLEYHRHFTHALPFAPLGGLACALFFYLFPAVKHRLSFATTYLYCFLGYLTHGLLDACTGYGTRLWWPFSAYRESWNIVAVIDPFYTLPALFLLLAACWRRSLPLTSASLLWMLAYLGLGAVQESRAMRLASAQLAAGSTLHEHLTARPTLGNLWLWRVLYADTARNEWRSFALYLPFWGGEPGYYPGDSAICYDGSQHAALPRDSLAQADIERFRYFSDGYLSWHPLPQGSGTIADARYSMLPHLAQRPLWGIQLPADPAHHVARIQFPRLPDWEENLAMLRGEGSKPLPSLTQK